MVVDLNSGMKKVFCIQCGASRIAEPDTKASEMDGKNVTKIPCECGCPYVELITEEHKN